MAGVVIFVKIRLILESIAVGSDVGCLLAGMLREVVKLDAIHREETAAGQTIPCDWRPKKMRPGMKSR